MQSIPHKQHIRHSISQNNCSECRADTERRFARNTPFHYAHVRNYLSYVRPRIDAIRNGESSVDARIWQRDFLKAMNRRITSHAARTGRKHSDSYLERLRQSRYAGSRAGAGYLRQFASRGASCLDS